MSKTQKTEVKKYTLSVPVDVYQEAKVNATIKDMFYQDYIIEAIKEKNQREREKENGNR